MKDLSNLKPNTGANRPTKRLGRGIGSGLGKTAGKGHKGQRARKSGGIAPGFEGGQTPLYRRLPKFGFTPLTQRVYSIVNIESLQQFDANTHVTPQMLVEAGLIKRSAGLVKILGKGNLTKPLKISVHKVSTSAKESIVKAGGQIEEIA
jgi:large subunit ribosomal protein L15